MAKSDLALNESVVLKSLTGMKRVSAFIFGGAFSISVPAEKDKSTDMPLTKPRMAVVYIPPMWTRWYYKTIYSKLRGLTAALDTLDGKRTFNPYTPKGTQHDKR
jgi:hypothetical protein